MSETTSTAELKRCTDCGVVKNLDEFVKNRAKKDGRGSLCRLCVADRTAWRRAKNPPADYATFVRLRAEARAEAEDRIQRGLKRCNRCGEAKDLDDFVRSDNAKDGRYSYCRPCHAFQAAWRQAEKNGVDYDTFVMHREAMFQERREADDLLQKGLKRCNRCGEIKPLDDFSQTAQDQTYCLRCQADLSNAQRDRYWARWTAPGADPYADPSWKRCAGCEIDRPRSDFPRARHKADGLRPWCSECSANESARRRALTMGVDATTVDRSAIYIRDEGLCLYCGEWCPPDDWHLDHITALVNGGPHEPWNVVVSCPADNLAKNAKEWPRVAFDPNATDDEPVVYPRGVMPVFIDDVKWVATTPVYSLN